MLVQIIVRLPDSQVTLNLCHEHEPFLLFFEGHFLRLHCFQDLSVEVLSHEQVDHVNRGVQRRPLHKSVSLEEEQKLKELHT